LSNGEFRPGLNEFLGILKRLLGLKEEMSTERARWRKYASSRVYRLSRLSTRTSGRTLNRNIVELPNQDTVYATNATVHGPGKDF
jgi:hypothetical protein